MIKLRGLLFALICGIGAKTYAQKTTAIWLDDLTIKSFSEGIPAVLGKTNAAGDSMLMNRQYFNHGVGVNATSILAFYLDGKAAGFTALVGVDDKGNKELPHTFYVIGDRKILFDSGEMKLGDTPKKVSIDLTGIKRLGLLVKVNDEGRTKVYSNWANAQFVMLDNHRPTTIPNSDEKYILTPASPKTPRINSATVFGATPNNPFLYTIATTGERPMQFSAIGLPKGLSLDEKTGIISGKVAQRGTYVATLKTKNALGEATKKLTIKIGDTIALTPPIGWNGWNSWARNIDQEKVIASADAMVKMGLRDHGWTYINIDDAWQGKRGGKFNAIQPNEKFPKFGDMVEYIHGLGLKVGVYSTPMITSYAGYIGGSSNFENGQLTDSIVANKRAFRYVGKYRFETNDARQLADWGIDYLKYDWRIEVPSAERMSVALKQSGRDILYSISNSAPFANVKDWARLTNSYRTGPDIRDSWYSLFVSAFTLDKWAPYGGPGHWNDPDMMIVGNVTTGTQLHPTRLTPDEQYSHVSLFSLLAAPLLIGCPIEQLDAFTLNLLTNDEVIAIDQDPLGKSARLVMDEKGIQLWLKPLEDGSYAVGLFNVGDFGKTPESYFRWGDEPTKSFTFNFTKIGLSGKYRLRDVWRQKDVGTFTGSFKTDIRHHGVVLLRMFPGKQPKISQKHD
ncbi:NPCBM/NEW2 domain-containing protein [Spirosoma migulaei]